MENDENEANQQDIYQLGYKLFIGVYEGISKIVGLSDEECYILSIRKVLFEVYFIIILGVIAILIKLFKINISSIIADISGIFIDLISVFIYEIKIHPILNICATIAYSLTLQTIDLLSNIIEWILTNIGFIIIYINKLNINNFFNISYYMDNASSVIISKEAVIAAVIGIIIYAYFFEYIKKKGVLANVIDPSIKYEGILFPTIHNLLSYFYLILYLFMILYLLTKQAFIETFILTYAVLLYRSSISQVGILTIKNLLNYNVLDKMNNNLIGIGITQRSYIEKLYNKILKWVFVSTLIWICVGLFFNFNIVSMLFLETSFIVWYFYINLIKYIPNHKVKLIGEKDLTFEDAFVIEDSSSDYKLLLTKKDVQYAMIGDSVKLEFEFYKNKKYRQTNIVFFDLKLLMFVLIVLKEAAEIIIKKKTKSEIVKTFDEAFEIKNDNV
jgi:hypothetical protein